MHADSNVLLWHRRLGHAPLHILQNISVVSYHYKNNPLLSCLECLKATQHCSSFSQSQSTSVSCFDLVHIDVWGPYKHTSYDGYKYFITVVDDYSRHTWVHMLTHKGYAFNFIKSFVKLVQTQFSKTIKVIRTDNAYEMGSSTECIDFYKIHGILHQKSLPYTPQ